MLKSIRNQTIALAGVSQAVYLVQQLAKRGIAETSTIESSISSVLRIDADNVDDVFGGLGGIAMGLRKLGRQLLSSNTMDPEQARYAAVLVFLEKKLMQDHGMVKKLRVGVEKAAAIAENRPVLDDAVIGALAETYQGTVSQLSPKIMVNGEQIHLTNLENANRIRALLLAGIRSVVLWKQCGGSRFKFFFTRGKILAQTQQLLKECTGN